MNLPITYAGIGSRQTPPAILKVMKQSAILLAYSGQINQTGACIGADQAFAEGALIGGGKTRLFLPWGKYEQAWINTLKGDIEIVTLDPNIHTAAMHSVTQYHPKAQGLKQSVIKLHARNFLILTGCTYVICWTHSGKITGGTGQAIRIAQEYKIKVHNLGNHETLTNFQLAINARIKEIPEYLR